MKRTPPPRIPITELRPGDVTSPGNREVFTITAISEVHMGMPEPLLYRVFPEQVVTLTYANGTQVNIPADARVFVYARAGDAE